MCQVPPSYDMSIDVAVTYFGAEALKEWDRYAARAPDSLFDSLTMTRHDTPCLS